MIRVKPGTDLGTLITTLLDLARMTPVDLARATGYAEGQVSKWRRGIVIPGIVALLRIVDALGYDLALVPREDA